MSDSRHPDPSGLRRIDWRRNVTTIAEAVKRARANDDRVKRMVTIVRFRGGTWAQIGEVLHISRQAAWSRFHEVCQHGERPPHHKARLQGALKALRFVGLRGRDIDALTAKLVVSARAAGHSWAEIAGQLDVRPQTAWERYHRLCVFDETGNSQMEPHLTPSHQAITFEQNDIWPWWRQGL